MTESIQKYVIANWKMHGRRDFLAQWCKDIAAMKRSSTCVVLAPPMVYLDAAKTLLPNTIHLGAQDVATQGIDGAHTGDVSAEMLEDIGCEYVIIGHSERRAKGEKNEVLLHKLLNTLGAGLIPVFCVGESLAQREQGKAWSFVESQLELLEGLPEDNTLIIAYEPIWAIGTGKNATVDDVIEMHSLIHGKCNRPVLYGGSVKPSNAQALLTLECVSGALVGGASLKPSEFLSIVGAAS